MLRPAPLVLAASLLASAPAAAQVSWGGMPPSLDPELSGALPSDVPVAMMEAVDVAELEAEDAVRDLDSSLPFRFGADLDVKLDAREAGRWDVLPDGRRVWRLAVLSPGATALSFAFDRWTVPRGGAFFVTSADGDHVLGAFTDANVSDDGLFATTLVPGDEAILEYVGPAGAELALARVTHAYREAKAGAAVALNHSGACMNNVACSMAAGWEDEIAATAKYTMGGSLCSGALINNTAHDGTPYFLTANHCYDGSPGWWVFWFNYESDACANPSWNPAYDSMSGASYRASSSSSDFVLVELNSDPPSDYGVVYAGWDRSSSPADSVVGIHHPGGDIKKFSVEDSQIWTSGNYWGVGPWDSGATEGGSSGSPLFNQDHRIVGQLYGGGSACWGSSPNNGTDIYGRLDVSWGLGLSSYLDPGGTGATAIDGFDPNAPTAEHDASIAIVSPGTAQSCATSAAIEVELGNGGSATLTSATIRHRVDGGAWTATSWSGALAQGGAAVVSLGTVAASGGSHSLEVTVDAPGDELPGNDAVTQSFGFVEAVTGPVGDGFGGSFPPSGWSLNNADGNVGWARSGAAGGGAAWFNNFDDDHRPETDYLYLPYVDLTSIEDPALTFDVAYARYNAELNDRLKVYVSDDCGDDWTVVYDKAGTTLATAPDHSESFVPTSAEWRTETVDLSAFASSDTVVIAFGNVTGYGNDVWLDDVSVSSADDAAAGDDDDAAGDDDDGGGDDDDAPPTGVCGNAPNESVHESEPNDWASSGQFDAVESDGGDLRLSGTISCGSSWSEDRDWFVVDLPCTGSAGVTLDWASGSDLDYWIYGPDRELVVKNEDEDYSGPAARTFSSGDKLFIAVSCWSGGDRDYTLAIDWDEGGEPATQTEGSDDAPADEDAPAPAEEAEGEGTFDGEGADDPPAPEAAPSGPTKFVQAGCSVSGSGPGPLWGMLILVGMGWYWRRDLNPRLPPSEGGTLSS